MEKLVEIYGNLTEKESNIITMSNFEDNNIKKLEFGFNPLGYYNVPNTLLYYWWDILELEIEIGSLRLFETELLKYFNQRYNKNATQISALYVGTTKRVNDY